MPHTVAVPETDPTPHHYDYSGKGKNSSITCLFSSRVIKATGGLVLIAKIMIESRVKPSLSPPSWLLFLSGKCQKGPLMAFPVSHLI